MEKTQKNEVPTYKKATINAFEEPERKDRIWSGVKSFFTWTGVFFIADEILNRVFKNEQVNHKAQLISSMIFAGFMGLLDAFTAKKEKKIEVLVPKEPQHPILVDVPSIDSLKFAQKLTEERQTSPSASLQK